MNYCGMCDQPVISPGLCSVCYNQWRSEKQSRFEQSQSEEILKKHLENEAVKNERFRMQKIEEEKKRTKLIEEQVITIKAAFEEGKKVTKFFPGLLVNPEDFSYSNSSYLNTYLNEAFSKGVIEKFNEIFNLKITEELRLQIKEFAIALKDLISLYRENINTQSNGFFSKQLIINYQEFEFDFGNFEVNLRVQTDEKTGELFFENEDFKNPTFIEILDKDFIYAFEYKETLLKINNQEFLNERLRLLEIKRLQILEKAEQARIRNLELLEKRKIERTKIKGERRKRKEESVLHANYVNIKKSKKVKFRKNIIITISSFILIFFVLYFVNPDAFPKKN